ncbi:MAG: UDP-N-acetylmuramate--L-alanine ligase [Thermovirgaceae bacterium]|nr:UDP-N-acetylmuramate--L-alanine ligase [Synergistales bacterium]MDI9392023.1 UDP-N-acetylmuramate--L-alanine ligase [Synergistota bacterium]MDY0178860.1 UDP-N-acetylmuramate--L-alanine ligase [Synergistaceae bacterium]HRW87099.1 UDP-N-acetylmuramate--L-alanine ligase [Thermovirgaceae bacterium]MDD3829438.1 UDP-N-acetylmuramate--L-alanine ligase [Synergistales bacterium]
MNDFDGRFENLERVHLMGIGGAGMSGLALLLRQIGMKISGCDVSHTYYINKISPNGIEFALGHDKEHLDRFKPDAIVFSSAIPSETEELVEAARRGIRIFKRAEVLSWLFNLRKGIGVAGTHGKTTTASMIGLILENAGLDPSVAIGGELCDIGGNAKLGQGAHMVAELDESDGSFELFRSHVAIVTNADWDHVDYYPSFSSVLKAYERFLSNREPGGAAIICGEDKGLSALLQNRINGRHLTYGWGARWDWGAQDVSHNRGGGVTYTLSRNGTPACEIFLQVSGEHNVLNSLAACAAADTIGIPLEVAAQALRTFKGAKRRLQHMGSIVSLEVDIFDDYGHHPREIAATLGTLKKMFPERRVMAVFQPHRFTRTAAMYRDFAEVLSMADGVFLLPVFPADEMPIEGVSSTLIGDILKQKGHKGYDFCSDMDEVVTRICSRVREGDVIATIGAGDVSIVGEKIQQRLERKGVTLDAVAIKA